MKRKLILTVLLAILLLIAVRTGYAYLADYSIAWWSVDAGGGTSDGDSYKLSGNIGQPDAGLLTGGDYTLAGGFWGGGWLAERQLYLPIITR